MKFGFRDIFIFFMGTFSVAWYLAYLQENLIIETYSGVALIVCLIFAIAWSHKSHEEREIERQLKNARKINGN